MVFMPNDEFNEETKNTLIEEGIENIIREINANSLILYVIRGFS